MPHFVVSSSKPGPWMAPRWVHSAIPRQTSLSLVWATASHQRLESHTTSLAIKRWESTYSTWPLPGEHLPLVWLDPSDSGKFINFLKLCYIYIIIAIPHELHTLIRFYNMMWCTRIFFLYIRRYTTVQRFTTFWVGETTAMIAEGEWRSYNRIYLPRFQAVRKGERR